MTTPTEPKIIVTRQRGWPFDFVARRYNAAGQCVAEFSSNRLEPVLGYSARQAKAYDIPIENLLQEETE